MAQSLEERDIHELQMLAQKLRQSAAETIDLYYIGLFLRTAVALDERVSQLALGPADLAANRTGQRTLHASLMN